MEGAWYWTGIGGARNLLDELYASDWRSCSTGSDWLQPARGLDCNDQVYASMSLSHYIEQPCRASVPWFWYAGDAVGWR